MDQLRMGRGYSMKDAQNAAAIPQPAPQGEGVKVLDLVLQDLRDRAEAGRAKYGVYLQTHNGRDALMDAYQEALDLCMYLRQAIAERDGEGPAANSAGNYTLVLNRAPAGPGGQPAQVDIDRVCAAWEVGDLSEGQAAQALGVNRLIARGYYQLWLERNP